MGLGLPSGCCAPRAADGKHMMRLADPPLLSPVGVHSVTSMLYLGPARQSEITINPVGSADVCGKSRQAPAEPQRLRGCSGASSVSGGGLILCH